MARGPRNHVGTSCAVKYEGSDSLQALSWWSMDRGAFRSKDCLYGQEIISLNIRFAIDTSRACAMMAEYVVGLSTGAVKGASRAQFYITSAMFNDLVKYLPNRLH